MLPVFVFFKLDFVVAILNGERIDSGVLIHFYHKLVSGGISLVIFALFDFESFSGVGR